MKTKLKRTIGIQGIGKLEAEIFAMLCEDFENPVTVRDIYEVMRLKRKIAYTTVMSVLTSLASKNLVNQDKSGIAYVYTPEISNFALAEKLINEITITLLRKELKDLRVRIKN